MIQSAGARTFLSAAALEVNELVASRHREASGPGQRCIKFRFAGRGQLVPGTVALESRGQAVPAPDEAIELSSSFREECVKLWPQDNVNRMTL
jgi:hypothetical protein